MATVVTIDSEGARSPFTAYGPYQIGSTLYAISCDFQTFKLLAYSSVDNGANWSLASSDGPEIYTYTVAVGMSTVTRHSIPGVYFDGTAIHIAYFKAAATAEDAFVTHVEYTTTGWSTPVESSWSASGGSARPALPLYVCAWPAGGIAVGYSEANSGGGWLRGAFNRFDGSWSGAQTIGEGTYSTSSCGGIAANTVTSGVHYVLTVGVSLNHVAIASDGSEGTITFVSGSSGATPLHAISWVNSGAERFAVLWTESTKMEAAITLSSSISFSNSTIYTRVSGESALAASGRLVPIGGSLHALFWWLTVSPTPTTEGIRLYKSCLPYTEAGGAWSTATLVANHDSTTDEDTGSFSAFASGSGMRGVYAPGFVEEGGSVSRGDCFIRYITESLASCASCCCSNFAY